MAASDPFLIRAIDHMRRYSQDTLDEVRWPASSMAELLDTANGLTFEYMLQAHEPKSSFRITEATISLVNGTSDYQYPGNFRQFLRFVKKDSLGNITQEIYPSAPLSDLGGINLFEKMRGFRIVPTPTVSEDWVLQYEPTAVPYLCCGRIDSGSLTTTSVVLKAPVSSYTTNWADGELGVLGLVNNFYVGSYLWVKHSDGLIGKSRITAWVASTRTATLETALPFSPTADDLYQIMPCLDHPFDKAIMWRAVMMMKAGDADIRHRATANEEFKAIMAEVLSGASNVQNRFGPSMGVSFMEDWDYGDLGDVGRRIFSGMSL